jgi:hypothetical protein
MWTYSSLFIEEENRTRIKKESGNNNSYVIVELNCPPLLF